MVTGQPGRQHEHVSLAVWLSPIPVGEALWEPPESKALGVDEPACNNWTAGPPLQTRRARVGGFSIANSCPQCPCLRERPFPVCASVLRGNNVPTARPQG